jgi:hypothetical protein
MHDDLQEVARARRSHFSVRGIDTEPAPVGARRFGRVWVAIPSATGHSLADAWIQPVRRSTEHPTVAGRINARARRPIRV